MDRNIEEIARAKAQKYGLDPLLVMAVILQESSGRPHVDRYEPAFFKQYIAPMALKDGDDAIGRATSWGLMQVMGQVARELGYKGKFDGLYDPETGIEYGCKKLAKCVKRYPGDINSAIAAYNAGSARIIKGVFVNQGYVDSVNKHIAELKQSK